jgi:hypothetical protein
MQYVFEEFHDAEATYDFEGSQIEEATMVWFLRFNEIHRNYLKNIGEETCWKRYLL